VAISGGDAAYIWLEIHADHQSAKVRFAAGRQLLQIPQRITHAFTQHAADMAAHLQGSADRQVNPRRDALKRRAAAGPPFL
jgi:hypothetical protein